MPWTKIWGQKLRWAWGVVAKHSILTNGIAYSFGLPLRNLAWKSSSLWFANGSSTPFGLYSLESERNDTSALLVLRLMSAWLDVRIDKSETLGAVYCFEIRKSDEDDDMLFHSSPKIRGDQKDRPNFSFISTIFKHTNRKTVVSDLFSSMWLRYRISWLVAEINQRQNDT